MTRGTPLSIYLTALSYTTSVVILVGVGTVQCASEWSRIRGTGVPAPTSHESSHRIEAVKPASRSFRADSARVSSVGAIPGTHNPAFFALDGGRGHWSSQHGVAREPSTSLRVFTETGRGPFLQAFRDGATVRERSPIYSIGSGLSRGLEANRISGQAGVNSRRHLETLVKTAAPLCGVRPALGWSIAMRESSGRHWDASGEVLRSSAGAVGILQIKPSTARDVDPKLDVMQPWGNALAGLCYFRQMLDRAKGNVRLALAYYHRGPNAKGPTPQASHDYATDIIEGSN